VVSRPNFKVSFSFSTSFCWSRSRSRSHASWPRGLNDAQAYNHRRIADEYCGGAAVTKFLTKYFRIELCVESLLCE